MLKVAMSDLKAGKGTKRFNYSLIISSEGLKLKINVLS